MGPLYCGKDIFLGSGRGYYWSVYKPGDGFDFNGTCYEMAEMVEGGKQRISGKARLAEKFHK